MTIAVTSSASGGDIILTDVARLQAEVDALRAIIESGKAAT